MPEQFEGDRLDRDRQADGAQRLEDLEGRALEGLDVVARRDVAPGDLCQLDVELLDLATLEQPRSQEALELGVGHLVRRSRRHRRRQRLGDDGATPAAAPPPQGGDGRSDKGGRQAHPEPRDPLGHGERLLDVGGIGLP
jgi:hypothetical protein